MPKYFIHLTRLIWQSLEIKYGVDTGHWSNFSRPLAGPIIMNSVLTMLRLSLLHVIYQSIPSLTIPPSQTPREFFERANFPSPRHKDSAKPRPLGQKNRAKSHPRDNYFQNSSKKPQNMKQKL